MKHGANFGPYSQSSCFGNRSEWLLIKVDSFHSHCLFLNSSPNTSLKVAKLALIIIIIIIYLLNCTCYIFHSVCDTSFPSVLTTLRWAGFSIRLNVCPLWRLEYPVLYILQFVVLLFSIRSTSHNICTTYIPFSYPIYLSIVISYNLECKEFTRNHNWFDFNTFSFVYWWCITNFTEFKLYNNAKQHVYHNNIRE